NWPRELLDMTYIQAFTPSPGLVRTIDAERKQFCASARREHDRNRCDTLDAKIREFTQRCTPHFIDPNERAREFYEDPVMYYNTAINYCHLTRFQIFLREVRLLKKKVEKEKS